MADWKYVGDGWLPGIPARDLSEDEVHELGIAKELAASPLYERVKEPAPSPAPTKTSGATEAGAVKPSGD